MLRPSAALRQSIFSSPELAILDLPRRSRFTLRAACGRVGSHSPPGMSQPSGCALCSLPHNRPVAWFPASARLHVFAPDQDTGMNLNEPWVTALGLFNVGG